MTGGLPYGLGVALTLGILVGSASGTGNALLLPVATAQSAGTTAPIRIDYGADPRFQFGDLRVPSGPGPHPVAVVIHGGCWHNSFALDLMDAASEALTAAGLATWNNEYRRLEDPGGGYPNTFTDVGMAIDKVRHLAAQYHLNLGKVITVGHSAGGHLGVWAAVRPRLPRGHPLRGRAPLPLFAVVALAGILNLAESLDLDVCNDLAEALLGGLPEEVPARYAATSPSDLVPLGVRQVLIHGTDDVIVPLVVSQHYRQVARAAGDHHVRLKKIHHGNHFTVIDPVAPQWPQVLTPILQLVK
jgi:acetyl esterase/lipase